MTDSSADKPDAADLPQVEQQVAPAPAKPARIPVASVTDLGLSLVRVQLTSLLCVVEQGAQAPLIASTVDVKQSGTFVPGSLSPTGFRSEVTWSLDFPGEVKPFSLAGKHIVVYSTSCEATCFDAEFYSRVNAIILLHPYLRQMVDDLSTKALGQTIMVRTLDVLSFVRRETERYFKWQESQLAKGD